MRRRRIPAPVEGGGQVINLVEALGGVPAMPSPAAPIAVTFAAAAGDLEIACGTKSRVFNAKLARETISACARAGAADFDDRAEETLAELAEIAPRDAIEAGLASLYVAARAAAMDCHRLARSHGFGSPMSEVLLSQADRLTSKSVELVEALARRRGGGQQRVVIEHVHVYRGGKAIVGMVGGDIPSSQT
jgi:hypothetical protein